MYHNIWYSSSVSVSQMHPAPFPVCLFLIFWSYSPLKGHHFSKRCSTHAEQLRLWKLCESELRSSYWVFMFRPPVLHSCASETGLHAESAEQLVLMGGVCPTSTNCGFPPPLLSHCITPSHSSPLFSSTTCVAKKSDRPPLSGILSNQAENMMTDQPGMKCQVAADYCVIFSDSE